MKESNLPIGTNVLRYPIGFSSGATSEEFAVNPVLATQGVNVVSLSSQMYLDWSKIWGMFNGDYYKFLAVIGGRGIGKTYGVWDYIVTQYKKGYWHKQRMFSWLRTTESAVETLKKNYGQKLCDGDVQLKHNVKVYTVGDNIYIRDMPKERLNTEEQQKWNKKHPGTHVGYLQAVSTFYKDKGTAWNEVKLIILDEVNREKSEKKTFDLAYAWTNQLESIARTRADVRVIMLGNTISDASDILSYLNFSPRDYGTYRLRGKRTIIMYIEDRDSFKQAREESLSYIFSGGGKGMPSLANQLANDELFKPEINYISRYPGNIFMYRMYFTRDDFFDIYSIKKGYWIGRTRITPDIKRIFSLNPDLHGVVPYNRDIVLNLKKSFQMKHIVYQSESVAHTFKAALEAVTSLK